ncbi:MAG: DUF6036 family nucleotidyltransferase [Gaiellaceae bacterium]
MLQKRFFSPSRSTSIRGAIPDGLTRSTGQSETDPASTRPMATTRTASGPRRRLPPDGWEERLVRLEIPSALSAGRPVNAWCLEVHDLLLAKLAAGRPHDLVFVEGAISAGLVEVGRLLGRVELMRETYRKRTGDRLNAVLVSLGRV